MITRSVSTLSWKQIIMIIINKLWNDYLLVPTDPGHIAQSTFLHFGSRTDQEALGTANRMLLGQRLTWWEAFDWHRIQKKRSFCLFDALEGESNQDGKNKARKQGNFDWSAGARITARPQPENNAKKNFGTFLRTTHICLVIRPG